MESCFGDERKEEIETRRSTQPYYKKVPIYQNQVIGIVSLNEEKRLETLQTWQYDLQKPSAYWVRGVRNLQDKIISGDKEIIEKLKEQNAKIDDEIAEGLLVIVGIFDNRKITELTPFECKKVQMIDAFATDANVLVMGDLYENVTEDEKKELDQILVEFSVCRTILLTASDEKNIGWICDKIINLDES